MVMVKSLSVAEKFALLCPLWTKAIKANGETAMSFKINKQLRYLSNARCLVGEAHGFNDNYAKDGYSELCYECSNYSSSKDFCELSESEGIDDRLLANYHSVSDFVFHMEDKHKDLCKWLSNE